MYRSLAVLLLLASGCGGDATDAGTTYLELLFTKVHFYGGYYRDACLVKRALPDEERGPRVEVVATGVRAEWRGAFYEDCREPNAVRLDWNGSLYSLAVVERDTVDYVCSDNADVVDLAVDLELDPGVYEITLACEVCGGGLCNDGENATPRTFQVDVPADRS